MTLKGAVSDPSTAYEFATRAIDAAILYGFYVIVDWHTEKIYTAEAKAFFGRLAKEYGNTPNIIWEIYNEPNGVGWGQIADYAKQVIPEIRKYSKNVILVGNSSWDQHPDEAGTELDGFANIAYTVHFYSDHTFWGVVGAAQAKGHAVFASEWGMSSYSGDGGFSSITGGGNITKWIQTLNDANVSHCNWSFGNAASGSGTGSVSETSAALNLTGVSTTGPWADGELTESGKSMKAYLISKNPVWTLADTSLKATSPLKISSDKTTNFILGADSIEFSASFNRKVKWSLIETGRTSKATCGTLSTKDTANISFSHVIGKKDRTSGAFQLGETVDAVITPGNAKVSYTISTVSGVLQRVHEAQVSWNGSRLIIPHNLINEGSPIRVSIRNLAGQAVFQSAMIMGAYGEVPVNMARPKSTEMQILEITSGSVAIHARLAPKF
jgi:endoglucanase